jgi:hypothetical protein
MFDSCNNGENRKTDSMFSEFVTEKTFYPSGKIKELTQRKENGQMHGFRKRYFENGNIEFEQTYFKDKIVGSQYWYHKNGALTFYSVKDNEDSVFFFLRLDSSGRVIEKMGTIMNSEYEIEGGKDALQLNKTYFMRFLYADPKIYAFNLDSVILATNNSKKHFKNYYFEKGKGEIIFEFKPKQRGNQKLTLYSSLKDKKGNTEYSNYLDIVLFVK